MQCLCSPIWSHFCCYHLFIGWCLFFSCAQNCFNAIDSEEFLSLEGKCIEHCSDEMEYSWSLSYKDEKSPSWKQHNSLESLLSTSPKANNIVLKPRTLIPGMQYVLSITGNKLGLTAKGRAEYRFTVNYPPSDGTCAVNTTSGKTLVTSFSFYCTDWVDKEGHLPLKYEFSYKDPSMDLERLLLSSDYPRASTILPVGDKKTNFTLQIVIKIRDRYDATTKRILNVTVCKTIYHIF